MDTETKKAFYGRLVELLATAPDIRREDVMVVITTTAQDEWQPLRFLRTRSLRTAGDQHDHQLQTDDDEFIPAGFAAR